MQFKQPPPPGTDLGPDAYLFYLLCKFQSGTGRVATGIESKLHPTAQAGLTQVSLMVDGWSLDETKLTTRQHLCQAADAVVLPLPLLLLRWLDVYSPV